MNFKLYEYEAARASVFDSLQKLKAEYLDLVLLHWPFGNYYAAYRALEDLYAEGLIRAIGVSNFNSDRMIDLIQHNKVVPAVNQIETNLLCQRNEENQWMQKYNVRHEAYAPLGQGKRNEMFKITALVKIAERHGKTPAQIALKYQIQRGIAVIPKSAHMERIKENFELFDFELTHAEMDELKGLDKAEAMIGNPQNPELVESAMRW